MARLDEGATDRWLTPSRLAERDLSGETLVALGRIDVRTELDDDLVGSFARAWEFGTRLWRSLAEAWEFRLPPLAGERPEPDPRQQ
jgi:lincosamide nucleotidyltransferase